MPDQPRDRAAEILDRKRRSHAWLETNFYPQWEEVYRSYQCIKAPEVNPETKQPIAWRTAVAAPDTWSSVNRNVARLTAQIPNVRFRCDDPDISELISSTLMYQWDSAGIQRVQKKHVRQSAIFGWSVRPWWWERQLQIRSKRVDVFDEQMTPDGARAIVDLYKNEISQLAPGVDPMQAFAESLPLRGALLAAKGRGNLLPVRYPYVAYEGPKADFLFVGDCYPEPNFQGIQTSQWFIVERRRNKQWLLNIAKAMPALAPGIADLLSQYPNGTAYRPYGTSATTSLRTRLSSATGLTEDTWTNADDAGQWTITEEHRPGDAPTLSLVGEDSIWIGELPYPYDLDGQIAFTECILCDNLLHGIGDSDVRALRALQEMHSKLLGSRTDLYDFAMRPLIGTTDMEFYENPQKLNPGPGFRVMHFPGGPNSIWVQDFSELLGAAAQSHGDEAALMRLWQTGTGDSNISMSAGVDPQQGRTATGARLMAANLDTLTKDKIDMFSVTSLRADAEMMFLLNRSELSDVVSYDPAPYIRDYTSGKMRQAWAKVEPMMFQRDGRIMVEAGSTLADDDDAKVEKSHRLYSMFAGNPLIDQKKLATDVLVSFGKGREVDAYLAKEPQGPTEPPVKASASISFKGEMLPPEVQQTVLQGAGLLPPGGPPINAPEPPPDASAMPPDAPMPPNMQPPTMPSPGPAGVEVPRP